RFAEPELRRGRVLARQGVGRERAEVLDAEVAVAGPLEPLLCLVREPLGLLCAAAVVRDISAHERRAGLFAPAAELRADLGAPRERVLGLGQLAGRGEQKAAPQLSL